MISKHKIGVVLCTYNGQQYIHEQIESILNQTRQPDQILILDDGSNDSTIKIVENFAKFDRRICLVKNQKTLGYGRNFEKGISLCETDFIALSDQDDVWLPEKLEILTSELEANPGAGIAFCNAEYITSDGTRTAHTVFSDKFSNDPVQARRGLLENNWNVHGNLIMLDSQMKKLILPNIIVRSHAHDSWICLNAYFLCNPRYITESLSLYRLHPKMASGAITKVLKGTPFEFKKKWYDHRRLMRNLFRIFSSPFIRPRILRERKQRAYNHAQDMITALDLFLNKRNELNLPKLSHDEQLFFSEIREAWSKVVTSQL